MSERTKVLVIGGRSLDWGLFAEDVGGIFHGTDWTEPSLLPSRLLGTGFESADRADRVVVVRRKGGDKMAIAVASPIRLVEIEPDELYPLPDLVRTPASGCTRGIVLREHERPLLVVDPARFDSSWGGQ